MRCLLDDWAAVESRLRASRRVALFLDFDGTLSALVLDPHAATIHPAARSALRKLSANQRVRTCIISGRRWADVRAKVGVPGIDYLGVHGGDLEGAPLPDRVLKAVRDARSEFHSLLNGSPVRIEDKGVAFAVHYRNVPYREVQSGRRLLDRILKRFEGVLRILPGDQVWEVLPLEIRGKGDAVRREWQARGGSDLPVYLGNDHTDESAFASLAEGITARVGPARLTRAHYSLRDPGEAARFLQQLASAVFQ